MPAHCRVHRRVSPGVGSNSGHPSPLRDDDKGLDERVDARLRERTKSAIDAPTRVRRVRQGMIKDDQDAWKMFVKSASTYVVYDVEKFILARRLKSTATPVAASLDELTGVAVMVATTWIRKYYGSFPLLVFFTRKTNNGKSL